MTSRLREQRILPQLAGINGLNGGPQLLFAVCQNVQVPDAARPALRPHTLGFLLLHGVRASASWNLQ